MERTGLSCTGDMLNNQMGNLSKLEANLDSDTEPGKPSGCSSSSSNGNRGLQAVQALLFSVGSHSVL